MIKKVLLLILVLVVSISCVACGNETESTPSTENSQNSQQSTETTESTESTDNSSKNEEGSIAFTQDDKFPLPTYSVYCPESCYVSNSKYGRAFTYENCSVILEAPSTVGGNSIDFNGFDDVVEKCKTYVCSSLESRNIDIFSSGATEQNISEQKKVSFNDIVAIRVIGTFKNTIDNTEKAYVAYYLLGVGFDGKTHPVYIVGISLDDNTSKLENFMDEMAKNIKK